MARRLLLLAVVAAVFAAPASASAAQTLGSNLQGAANWLNCNGGSCLFLQNTIRGDENVNVVPSAGKITGFSVRRAGGSYRLVVVRVQDGLLVEVGGSPVYNGSAADIPSNHTLPAPIAVQPGDAIALEVGDGGSIGIRTATEGDTNLFQVIGGGTVNVGPHELFLSATLEPDLVTGPVLPRVDDPIVPGPSTEKKPDPLAALRAGKLPKAAIAGGALPVSKKRVATLKVTNPNGYALKGAVTLLAGKKKLGSRKVTLPAGASKSVKVPLSKKAMKKLKKRRKLAAQAVAKLKGPIGKPGVTRKKVTLKAPAKPKRKKSSGGQGGSGGGGTKGGGGGGTKGGGGGGNTPARSNVWNARKGSEGAYDDFQFTLDGDTINLTKQALQFVTCFEVGGSYQSHSSYEIFNLLGPWRLGNESETQNKRSIAVNKLVSSGERTITYKLTSARVGDKITGKLTMTFSDSKYDPFTNKITFINCAGTESFEAING